jgi:hypothetical protein
VTPAKITLKQNGSGSVLVDGLDIASRVSSMTVTVDPYGRGTEATIQLSRVELEADAGIRVDDRTRDALLKLGWTPPRPKTEQIGDATVEINPDGTRVVTHADDTILLAEMEKLGNYTDNVFTLDTAGEYRYRSAGFFGPNAVFERIHETETPA